MMSSSTTALELSKSWVTPEDVFPPTDFHSATLVNGFIYLVGRLGYHGTREIGTTPVYRMNCRNWSIQRVQTFGDNPGWIFKHKATLDGPVESSSQGEQSAKKLMARSSTSRMDIAFVWI
jgi:hypothetical protein